MTIKKTKQKQVVAPEESLEKIRKEITPKPVDYVFGRPTKYRPEYCQGLIDHMSKGLSYETYSATIGTCRETLYAWEKAYPDFLNAKKKAFEECNIFWERMGMHGVMGKIEGFNATMWIFNMKNRFKWTDRIESNVSANVNVTPKVIFGTDPDDDTGN